VVQPAIGNAPFDTRKEIGNILVYLVGTHGLDSVRPVLGDALVQAPADSLPSGKRRRTPASDDVRRLMSGLGMEYVGPYETGRSNWYYYNRAGAPMRALHLRDANYHVRLDGSLPASFVVGGEVWRLEGGRGRLTLLTPRDSLFFPIDALAEQARIRGGQPDTSEVSPLTEQSRAITATLVPNSYSGTGHAESAELQQIAGDLYLKLSPESEPPGEPKVRSPRGIRP
jgi:hypothetical protein